MEKRRKEETPGGFQTPPAGEAAVSRWIKPGITAEELIDSGRAPGLAPDEPGDRQG